MVSKAKLSLIATAQLFDIISTMVAQALRSNDDPLSLLALKLQEQQMLLQQQLLRQSLGNRYWSLGNRYCSCPASLERTHVQSAREDRDIVAVNGGLHQALAVLAPPMSETAKPALQFEL